MLLLNPIVRKTSEKRSRWWTRLAGFGLWSVLQPICMSLNIRSIKEEHDDVYTAPFLVALWHNRTMVPGYACSLECIYCNRSPDLGLVKERVV